MKLLYVFKEKVVKLKADVREIAAAAVRPIHQKKMRTK